MGAGSLIAAAAAIVLMLNIHRLPPSDIEPADGAAPLAVAPDALVEHLAVAMDSSYRNQWQLAAADGAELVRGMLSPLPAGP